LKEVGILPVSGRDEENVTHKSEKGGKTKQKQEKIEFSTRKSAIGEEKRCAPFSVVT